MTRPNIIELRKRLSSTKPVFEGTPVAPEPTDTQKFIADRAAAKLARQERQKAPPVALVEPVAEPVKEIAVPAVAPAPEPVTDAWMEGLMLDVNDKIMNNRANILKIVRNHPAIASRISHDDFEDIDLFVDDYGKTVPFQTPHYTTIMTFIQEHCSVPHASIRDVMASVDLVMSENRVDMLQQHLESLEPWDGVERLDTWLIDVAGAEDTPSNRMYSRKFIIGLVERALNPGCIAKRTLVLLGEQNIGKSSMLAILAGSSRYDDSIHDIGADNNALHLRGRWLVEVAENVVGYKDRNLLKSYLSRTTDNYRLPYDRQASSHPRRSVFCITTNDSEGLLSDPTGSSRFCFVRLTGFPVDDQTGVHRVRFDLLKSIRDQLLAEAVYAVVETLETNELPPAFEALANEQNKEIETYDDWQEELYEYLKHQETAKLRDIKLNINTTGSTDLQANTRIKNMLIQAGWVKVIIHGVHVYRRKNEASVPAFEPLVVSNKVIEMRSRKKGLRA